MTDTIFAPATAAGRSAVAVVRLSGPGAGAAVKALAGKLPRPREAALRVLRDGQGERPAHTAGDPFEPALKAHGSSLDRSGRIDDPPRERPAAGRYVRVILGT